MAATITSATITSALPLTTLFTPKKECLDWNGTLSSPVTATETLTYITIGNASFSDCMPPGWHPTSYFSPGVCPYGYTVATSSFDSKLKENIAHCCPSGFSYHTKTLEPDSPERCTTTIKDPFQVQATGPNGSSATMSATAIKAYDVSVKWRSDDFFNPTTDTTEEPQKMSSNAKAIIGFSVAAGIALLTTIVYALFFLWRRRVRASSNIQDTKEPGFKKGITLDSWLLEFIAMFSSVAFFAAIFYLLSRYNQQEQPKAFHGVTLNTMISILSAFSKSSLIFIVGECIGQLRWTSLQDTIRSRALYHVQLYDSASRGPWGSLVLIKSDKFRSLVAIGAFITVLGLSFDPFVQQVITYPDRQVGTLSSKASVKQSREFASDFHPSNTPIFVSTAEGSEYTVDFLGTMTVSPWSNRSSLEPICPSGQCTWPRFKSIEFCTRCEDITTTSTLVGCDDTSHDPLNGTQKNIETSCHLALPQGRFEQNDGIWLEKPDEDEGNFNQYYLIAPSKIVGYVYEPTGFEVHPVDTSLTSLLNGTYAGIKRPLFVAASAEFDITGSARHSPNITVSELAKALRIRKVTQCAISFCTRTYDLSVSEGLPSSKMVEEDLGISTFPEMANPCWKPSPESQKKDTETNAPIIEVDGHKIADSSSHGFCYFPFTTAFRQLQLAGNSKEVYQSTLGDAWGWLGLDPSNYDKSFKTAAFERVTTEGLEPMIKNVASTLSYFARDISDVTVVGTLITKETYVNVRWLWLILPGALIVLGFVFLASTSFISRGGKSNLWKTSVLPFLYHGLEDSLIPKHSELESVSKMEELSESVKVNLEPSPENGKLMIRKATKMSNKKRRRQLIAKSTPQTSGRSDGQVYSLIN